MSKEINWSHVFTVEELNTAGTLQNFINPPFSKTFNTDDVAGSQDYKLPDATPVDIFQAGDGLDTEMVFIPVYDSGVSLANQKISVEVTVTGPTTDDTIFRKMGVMALPTATINIKVTNNSGAALVLRVLRFKEV